MAELPAWHAHPDVWLSCSASMAAYLVALRTLGPRIAGPRRARRHPGQIALFAAGVAVLLVGAEWPLHDARPSGYLYSAHMVQHLLFTLIAPPLLHPGHAGLAAAASCGPVMPVARVVLRPAVAFVVFNAVLVITHWPAVVDASVGSERLHFALHVVLVGSGADHVVARARAPWPSCLACRTPGRCSTCSCSRSCPRCRRRS